MVIIANTCPIAATDAMITAFGSIVARNYQCAEKGIQWSGIDKNTNILFESNVQSLTIAIVFELIYYTNGHFLGMTDIHNKAF